MERRARRGWSERLAAACTLLALASCDRAEPAPTGASAGAPGDCALGDLCPVCGTDRASMAAATGTTCGVGRVCLGGDCVAACLIDGVPVLAGTPESLDAVCQGCNPLANAHGWSGLDDGSSCGSGPGTVCVAGQCVSGCAIGARGYAAGTVDPDDACRGCVPATSTVAWSPVLREGASCGTGMFCIAGTCAPGCSIDGTTAPAGTPNPAANHGYCQTCAPATSVTSWTNAADDTACSLAPNPGTGRCCGGACVDPASDPSHCGACGHSCTEAPAPTCAGGYCASTLGATDFSDSRLAVDANNVYWTTPNAVMQAPIAGGSAITLASGQLPEDVAVDASNVYFSSALFGASLMAVPIGGGTERTLSSTLGGNFIAVRAGFIYGTQTDPNVTSGVFVAALPTSGGTPVSLGWSPAVPCGLTVDATNVYVGTPTAVMKGPIAGGLLTTLVDGHGSPLAVDANNVYYGFGGPVGAHDYGPVSQIPIAGGTPTTIAAGMDSVKGIAVDDANVYWTGDNGDVLRAPIGGGPVTTLAANQHLCGDIAVDATHVYWITDVAVLRAPK